MPQGHCVGLGGDGGVGRELFKVVNSSIHKGFYNQQRKILYKRGMLISMKFSQEVSMKSQIHRSFFQRYPLNAHDIGDFSILSHLKCSHSYPLTSKYNNRYALNMDVNPKFNLVFSQH